MNPKILLDSNVFKALSAKSRVDILKHLNHRKYTQSELSQLLNMKVPSVKEHLTELERAELVQKLEEGRKWKYYQLTNKAKSILHPEEKQIFIALGVFVLSALGSGYLFLKNLLNANYFLVSQKSMYVPMMESVVDASKIVKESAPTMAMQESKIVQQTLFPEPNYLLYALGIIALIALIFLFYFLIKRSKIIRSLKFAE